MKGKDIFVSLNEIGDDLIEQAEYGTFAKKRRIRPLLMAAVIALLLMLVGCAVVYVLNMRNLQIVRFTEAQPVFSGPNLDITGYEDVPVQVLTLAGIKGTPNYQASRDWYQFKESYDPDGKIYLRMVEEGKLENYPPEYMTPVYTQEMREALDGILEKYHLLPQGELLEFRTVKNLCSALGIEKIQTAQNDVQMQITGGFCCAGGNFGISFAFILPEDESSQLDSTWGNLSWFRKDCFTPDYITISDTDDWKEWNYTTTAGSNVLIFRSPSDQRGWIVCQREEAQMVLQLAVRRDTVGGHPETYQYLTDRQMERIADAIDFSVQPNKVTREDVLNQPPYQPGVTQNGWNMELKSVFTDGYMIKLLLGYTAPEETDIVTAESAEDSFDIYPGNRHDFLIPEQGETSGANWYWEPLDDGDGKNNTQDCLLTLNFSMMDGSAPFADGTVWNLHIEDLMHHHWDAEKTEVKTTVLTEGEWNFAIRFGSENARYEKIDFLTEPTVLPVITGWDEEGNNIWESINVSNIELHPLSVHFLGERGEVDYGWVNIVMQDGRRIPASPVNYGKRCIYETTEQVDLYNVDYILLENGTQIAFP